MHSFYIRLLTNNIKQYMEIFPAVAILGPRQCGKSTLAKSILKNIANSIYLDLEKTSDLNKLNTPELFLEKNKDKIICLDEIQRVPEFFTHLRSHIDENRNNGKFLVLGSASPQLIKQSSESLAGRIGYLELTPFLLDEINNADLNKLWLRGGVPDSYLSKNDQFSYIWRRNFIKTFLERDIPNLGFKIPAIQLQRFWQMIAHHHGNIFNSTTIANSLGSNRNTIRSYLDILEQTYMVRILQPYHSNDKKRLVKSPKIYIRDSGILHALLQIEGFNDLLGHPIIGASWEGLVIENILAKFPDHKASFYRTSNGNEIDLILEKANKKIAIECKSSPAPKLGKGFYTALKDLNIDETWIIAPVTESYHLQDNVIVKPLENL